MIFTLKSEEFSLILNLRVFENDIQYPNNTIMDVTVESQGFCGKASMDIDIKEFAKFAVDLNNIYDNLIGEAKIAEPYGFQMYIMARGDGRGHIQWKGYLNNMGQVLEFENDLDQTYLRDFCHDLKTKYEKYIHVKF